MAVPSIQAASHAPQEVPVPTLAAAVRSRNKILNLLSPEELEAVLDRSEMVTVESQEIVFRRREPISYAYFPDNCVISLVTEMEDGDAVEAMTIGNDGFVPLAVFHEVPSSWLKAIGQITGAAWRIPAGDFNELTRKLEGLHLLMHRYSQFVFETVSQSAACNRLHVIEQRAARWLLRGRASSRMVAATSQWSIAQASKRWRASATGPSRPGNGNCLARRKDR